MRTRTDIVAMRWITRNKRGQRLASSHQQALQIGWYRVARMRKHEAAQAEDGALAIALLHTLADPCQPRIRRQLRVLLPWRKGGCRAGIEALL